MYNLKINLFGESWKLTRLNLAEDTYNEILKKAEKPNTSLSDVLLESISIDDGCHNSVQGLLNTYKNQIEVWYAGKKIKTLKMYDLDNGMLLFPHYQSTIKVLKYHTLSNGIYIEQEEIGLVACYEIKLEKFNLDDLLFEFVQVEKKQEKFKILQLVKYKNIFIKNSKNKTDTLVMKQICFEV